MEPSRFKVPQSSAACSRVFSQPDVPSEMMGLQSKNFHRLLACERARLCKPKSTRLGGQALFKSRLSPVAHPARVLSAGKPISDRRAGNSVILR
jgi:hypothetical protein